MRIGMQRRATICIIVVITLCGGQMLGLFVGSGAVACFGAIQ
jgi:hypothetical protein